MTPTSHEHELKVLKLELARCGFLNANLLEALEDELEWLSDEWQDSDDLARKQIDLRINKIKAAIDLANQKE